MSEVFTCARPEDMFDLGQNLATEIRPGDILLLNGGLGAGKTLLTKGILARMGYDQDEVTSPSFTLVNLYRTATLDVYHIDLWRIDVGQDAGAAVGLDEITEDDGHVVIIEWADRLSGFTFTGRTIAIDIVGDGEEARMVTVSGRKS